MRLFSRGPGQRLFRWVVFVVAIAVAWWCFGTYISADRARQLLLEDLNTP